MAGGKAPMTTNLGMEGIEYSMLLNQEIQENMKETSLHPKLFMMSKVDQNYMRRDKNGSLDGRLNMSNHRISGLADPTDADDAVTRRFVASRFQALSDEVQDNKSKLDALQNLLRVENNQVL